jgi:hypothetical protein
MSLAQACSRASWPPNFKTFAIPQIARELDRSGETQRHPEKRATDTGIAIYEILVDGHGGPRGQRMIELLRRVHRGVKGSREDYRHVLASLLVTPARHLQRYGPRPLTTEELDEGRIFYAELGRRIGTTGLPETYEGWESLVIEYERQYAAATDEARRLLASSLPVFRRKMPAPIRFLSRHALSALVWDEPVVRALQLPPPNGTGRFLIRRASNRSSHGSPQFTPGSSSGAVYGGSYDLADVGPKEEQHARVS